MSTFKDMAVIHKFFRGGFDNTPDFSIKPTRWSTFINKLKFWNNGK